MALDVNLVSQFAKSTVNKKDTKKETTVWGEVVEVTESGKCYVKLDGSDGRVTPVETLTEVKPGDRVSVTIKNHAATLTGNASSPSINADGSTIGGIRSDLKNISAENVNIKGRLTANEGYISDLTTRMLTVEGDLVAKNGRFETIEADIADIERLNATFATFEQLTAVDADIRNLLADYATIKHLTANYATINELTSNYATIVSLNAVDAKIGSLTADVADINTLIFGSASGTSIHTTFSNAVIAQLGDAQIKSAMIESISAGKITAGDIITNNVNVKSNDGKLLIADQTIQISDDSRVRVQIGKDAANDYSINIWDANGKLMFSEGGLTEDAVKEQIIRNDMVKDDANISASKLDIDTLFNVINEDGSHTLKSSKVKLDGENQTLDVAFKGLTTKIDDQSETISSQGTAISVIQGNISNKIWQQDITSAINDISIGGRNMLLNTGRDGSIKLAGGAYATYLATITDVTNTGGELALTCSSTSAEIYYRFMTPKTDDLYTLEAGKTYTFSGKAKIVTTGGTLNALRARSQDYISGGWSGGAGIDILTSDTDEWVDFVSTFTIREAATGVYVSVQVYYTDSWEGVVYLKDLKLEEGNVATAWTPAPEDVEKDITNLTTQYSALDQTIDSISATVAKHTTDIENKAESSQVSDLVVDLEGFRTSVSATYTTKAEFANLSVGGRNLIAGTSIDTVYSGVKPADKTSKDVWSAQTIAIPTENEYVVSFDAKADEDVEITCFFHAPNTTQTSESSTGDKRINATDGVSKVSITTEWKRYWVKWVQNGSSTTSKKSVIVGRNFSETNRVYIRAVKLEVGHTPSDWTPAPEDIDSDIAALTSRIISAETSINQTNEEITLYAKKSEVYTTGQIDDQWAAATEQFGGAISDLSDEMSRSYSKGRNLLRNTGGGGDVAIAYGNVSPAVRNITARTNENGIQTLTASATNQEIYYRFMPVENTNLHGLEPGKTYIFSGKVRVTTTSGSFHSLKVRSQHYATAGWQTDENLDVLETVAPIATLSWFDFYKTFTVPENATGYFLSFQIFYDENEMTQGAWSGTIEFKELKLEIGDQRTPWSLAPEDISGYYSKTQTDAQIQLTSEAITQTVSALTLELDNLSVGGRNLIAGTSIEERVLGGYPAEGESSNEGVTGRSIDILSGDEYVLSFDAKSTVNGDGVQCFLYDPNTTTSSEASTGYKSTSSDGYCTVYLTTEWKRYWVKYTQNGSATTTTKRYIVGRRCAGFGSGIISVRAIKLEAGHTPTDWTPAPEDMATISKVSSEIQQLADSIKLEVTSSVGKTAGITLTTGDKKTETELPVRKAFEDDPTAITISAGTVTFNSNTFVVDSTYFKVSSDGTINATGGTIGGMILHTYGIYSYSSSYPNSYAGLWSIGQAGYNGPCFFAGAASSIGENAKFYVTHAGKLYAGDAEIDGSITSIDGKEKAELTSGKLTFYYDGAKQGLISSKYHPNASSYGLTLRIPSMYENSLTAISFVHEVGSEGSGYVVDYQMNNFEDTGVTSGFNTDDGCNPRHIFNGGMMINGGLYVSGQIYPTGMIYLRNMCAIGWYDKDNGGPRQLISFGNDNVFTVGSNSYFTDIHKLTLPNGNSKGLFIKNADASTRLRVLEVDSANILNIGYGQYAKNSAEYSTYIYASNQMRLSIQGETIIFEKSSNSSYSAYLFPNSAGKCTLGKSNLRWYGVYTNIVNYTTLTESSDRRLKKDIETLSDVHSDLFDKLQPVQYKFINGDDRIYYGLIAQDVEAAITELGIGADDLNLVRHEYNVDNTTGELIDEYGIGYTNIIPMLIREVQKLKQEIKTLKESR